MFVPFEIAHVTDILVLVKSIFFIHIFGVDFGIGIGLGIVFGTDIQNFKCN